MLSYLDTRFNYILNYREPKKIFANDYSSMVVTNSDIYVCGTNFGQFGLKREVEKVPSPRKVNKADMNSEILISTFTFLFAFPDFDQ